MEPEVVFVVPASEDLRVPFPSSSTVLPKTGATVPWLGAEGVYWRRRLAEGSIRIVTGDEVGTNKNKKEAK